MKSLARRQQRKGLTGQPLANTSKQRCNLKMSSKNRRPYQRKPTLDILISDVQHYDARKLQLVVNDEIVPSYNISINETVDSQSVINEESDQLKVSLLSKRIEDLEKLLKDKEIGKADMIESCLQDIQKLRSTSSDLEVKCQVQRTLADEASKKYAESEVQRIELLSELTDLSMECFERELLIRALKEKMYQDKKNTEVVIESLTSQILAFKSQIGDEKAIHDECEALKKNLALSNQKIADMESECANDRLMVNVLRLQIEELENSFQETLSRERESHLSRETISSKLKIAYETNLKLQRVYLKEIDILREKNYNVEMQFKEFRTIAKVREMELMEYARDCYSAIEDFI